MEIEKRVHLIVRNIKPPFLSDGERVSLARQTAQVSTFKDPTSDIAVLARSGSALVKARRLERDRKAVKKRFWELGGSRMGKALGIVEEHLAARDGDEVGGDVRDASRFAHVVSENEAASDFSRNKTISEQREYLPVFSVRKDLLQVIRDNVVTIVVGETGSGKTTQLAQYLHEEGFTSRGRVVGCTQPRRVAAAPAAPPRTP